MEFVALAGIGISAYGAYQEGQYQKDYGKYVVAQTEQDILTLKSQVDRQTGLAESIAQENIKRTLQAGAEEEAAFREIAEITEGANMLAIARSGIIMKGSPLLVMNDIALKSEEEAIEIRYKADIQAEDIEYQKNIEIQDMEYGADITIAGMRRDAQNALLTGNQAASAAGFKTAATLLQGAGTLYGMTKKPSSKTT